MLSALRIGRTCTSTIRETPSWVIGVPNQTIQLSGLSRFPNGAMLGKLGGTSVRWRTPSGKCPGMLEAAYRDAVDNIIFLKLRGDPMANAERQMPGHVTAAYRDAVDNIIFLKLRGDPMAN